MKSSVFIFFIVLLNACLFAQAQDTMWTKTYGDSLDDWGNSVQQTTDGGYIITGCTDYFGVGGCDVWLIKTDANGDTLWTKTFGGSDVDYAKSIQQTTDGGYVIVGTTHSFGAGSSDVWLIKVAPDVTSINETLQTVINDYRLQQNYPNPFNLETVITYKLVGNAKVSLKIYDIAGREVKTLVNRNQPTGEYSVSFDASGLASGIYIYKLKASSFEQSRKMLFLR